ncbi:10316_t:CDS:10 [Ambispora gerdemannii]|uniref:10316_t:CDS:1 n=1 Tax=Ambispora gerdemannii TaxID=144530 RepID=A0A9N8WPE0_9GLOM|nr:10316_t:CDS:10 [Ambispora gerdemannii]
MGQSSETPLLVYTFPQENSQEHFQNEMWSQQVTPKNSEMESDRMNIDNNNDDNETSNIHVLTNNTSVSSITNDPKNTININNKNVNEMFSSSSVATSPTQFSELKSDDSPYTKRQKLASLSLETRDITKNPSNTSIQPETSHQNIGISNSGFSSRASISESRASTPSWEIESKRKFPNRQTKNATIFNPRGQSTDAITRKETKRARIISTDIEDDEDVVNDGETMVSTTATSIIGNEEETTTEHDTLDREDSLIDKVIMAVNFRNRKLVRFQISPSIILTSSRADEDFIEALKTTDESSPVESTVEIRPNVEFVWASAKTKLLSIKFGEPHGFSSVEIDASKKDMYLKLSSIVNMDSVETVCCAGALLSYIARARVTDELLYQQDQGLKIQSVEQFSLKTFLHVNADTLCSLQIFEDESHPNMHTRSRAKEGLSIFGILNKTRTPTGKQLFKQWFLRPSLDINILEERFRTIDCFLQPDNIHISEQLASCLKHVKNVPKILESMKGKLSIAEWQSLLQFAYYCLKIRNLVRELNSSENIQIFNKIRETFVVTELKDIGSVINDVIDFDESANENRVVVKLHIDEELDEMKRTYNGLDDFLSEVAREIATTIPSEFASSLNVIYFPQLGYLITVPLKPEWKEEEDFQIEGLYYQFSTVTTVYYKNDRMRELDEYLGDIHGLIVDREIEIMQRLQERVSENTASLLASTAVCAELDCLLSLAESARRYQYSRPQITEENILKIVKGRHPLQELCVDVFVANDTNLAGGKGIIKPEDKENEDLTFPTNNTAASSRRYSSSDNNHQDEDAKSVMLLSGANYSGKSIYLKQVAVIVFMTHIGSFVPAESAIIGLTDKIFTRVQTRETVSKIQSAFMIDLQQISIALHGAGLFCGVFEHLINRGLRCPKVIAATHFHEIFENNLMSPDLPISLATMEIIKDEQDDEITFLYRLVPGRSTASWGTYCATLAGVPENIVQRAKHLSTLFARYESIPPPFISDREKRLYASCELVARKFVEFDFSRGDGDANEMEIESDGISNSNSKYNRARESMYSDVEAFLDWVSREVNF